jgi:crotonobetainyl-CoA:carnitine CoA-transferase CaiB-like acyl-CoA transferase
MTEGAARPGEHNDEVLAELGLSREAIGELASAGALG